MHRGEPDDSTIPGDVTLYFATSTGNVAEMLPPVRVLKYATHCQGQDERAHSIPSTTCAALTVRGL